jgi:hypothetical protein
MIDKPSEEKALIWVFFPNPSIVAQMQWPSHFRNAFPCKAPTAIIMSQPYSIVFIIFISTRRRCPLARTVSTKPPIFCIRFSHFSFRILLGDGFAGIDPV